jgi:hypothetical protein
VPEYCDDRRECVAKQKGKKYTLLNLSKYIVKSINVDKCLVDKTEGKRCDYLMHITNKELQRAIFIELKGGDLSSALKQLCSTILFLKSEFKDNRMDARIVGSRDVPNIESTADYRKLARQILPTGGTIARGTNNMYIENC